MNDFPNEVYYLPRNKKVYTSVRYPKAKMTDWINRNLRSAGVYTVRANQIKMPSGIDWWSLDPPKVYRLTAFDEKNNAVWSDVTKSVFQDRMYEMGRDFEL